MQLLLSTLLIHYARLVISVIMLLVQSYSTQTHCSIWILQSLYHASGVLRKFYSVVGPAEVRICHQTNNSWYSTSVFVGMEHLRFIPWWHDGWSCCHRLSETSNVAFTCCPCLCGVPHFIFGSLSWGILLI